jgi:hypothetical protein
MGGRGEIHVFTSRPEALAVPGGAEVHVHRLAGRRANLAFVEATRKLEPEAKERLTVTAANFSASAARARLLITSGGAEIFSEDLDLPAGGRRQTAVRLPAKTGAVQVVLEDGGDALPEDSRLELLPQPPRRVAFRVAMSDARSAELVRRALEAAGAVAAGRGEDLLVSDRRDARGELATLVVPAFKKGRTVAGPFVVDLAAPLCRDLELSGIYWTCDEKLRPSAPAASLISCGSTGLYFFLEPRRLLLNVDPAKGNLARTDVWPVIFANLVDSVRPMLPGLRRANYRPGEPLLFVADPDGRPDLLRGPELELPLAGPAPVLPGRPGVYRLFRGERELASVAVAATSPQESDLRKLADEDGIEIVGRDRGRGEAYGRFGLSWAAVLGALLLLLLNWWLDLRESRR